MELTYEPCLQTNNAVERKTVITSYFSTRDTLLSQETELDWLSIPISNPLSSGHSCCTLAPRCAPTYQVRIHILFIVHHNHASSIDRCSYNSIVRSLHIVSLKRWIDLRVTWSPSVTNRVFKNEIVYNDKSGAREKSYDVHSKYTHDMHQVQTHVKMGMYANVFYVFNGYTWSTCYTGRYIVRVSKQGAELLTHPRT